MDIKKITESKNPYVEILIQQVIQQVIQQYINNLKGGLPGATGAVKPNSAKPVEDDPGSDVDDDVGNVDLFGGDDDEW